MTGEAATLRILGFEPFDAGSHRAVRESIDRHSRHTWTWLTRPARAWKWRLRLAAVELVAEAETAGCFEKRIDAIAATSLLSVADLRALLPARLRRVPVILYMHENQAAYPVSEHPRADPKQDVQFALTNLTSILAADLVIWNSRWNRDSFVAGMEWLLRRANAVELTGWRQRVEDRSRVIWPPVEPPPADLPPRHAVGEPGVSHNSSRVVWPHRWEHDKGPQELLEIAITHSESLNLRWTILGWEYPAVPPALDEFRSRLAGRIDHIGFETDRRRYWEHLARADWVLSTAHHEFFGIAVVEALLAGCLPWLPDRLSYPELLPHAARGLSPAETVQDRQGVVEAIREHLAPAVAPNAVARIDDAIDEAVTS